MKKKPAILFLLPVLLLLLSGSGLKAGAADNEFRLELEAYNYKQTVLKAKHVVLRTMPDEDFYSKEFRTVEIVGRYLVIKDFLDHDSFWIDLESVSEGVAVVIDKRDISEQDDGPLFKEILW